LLVEMESLEAEAVAATTQLFALEGEVGTLQAQLNALVAVERSHESQRLLMLREASLLAGRIASTEGEISGLESARLQLETTRCLQARMASAIAANAQQLRRAGGHLQRSLTAVVSDTAATCAQAERKLKEDAGWEGRVATQTQRVAAAKVLLATREEALGLTCTARTAAVEAAAAAVTAADAAEVQLAAQQRAHSEFDAKIGAFARDSASTLGGEVREGP